MRCCSKWLAIGIVLLATRGASAHFLWLQTQPEEKPEAVHLYFGETTVPGEAKLLDKVAHAKTWLVKPDGSTTPITLEKKIEGDEGSWAGKLDAQAPCCVETTCEYGVINRGGTFLLNYHAKNLGITEAAQLEKLGQSKQLSLDVQPRMEGDALVFQVLFEGKPAADAQLVVVTPDNDEKSVKLDANGVGRIAKAAPGDYAARANITLKKSGQLNGKSYDEIRHYSTATLRLPGKSAAKPAEVAEVKVDPAAVEMLREARAKRAVWENFAGFTADITVRLDGEDEKGTIEVDEYGTATVEMKNQKLKDWAEEQAASLVQHRLPANESDEKPSFADDETGHPLGRLLRLGDARYQSAYRIQDGVVTEVNRRAGPVRFTISVLETITNDEGKYLPRVFTMTIWDAATGEMKSTSTMLNTWTKAGDYDVPQRLLEVRSLPGDRNVREIVLTNYKLLKAASENAKADSNDQSAKR